MTSEKPNFRRVYERANELLVSAESIYSFPFSVKKFILEESGGVTLLSYQKAKQKYQLEVGYFGSDSAVLFQEEGRNVICYDKEKPDTHKKFSLLHEFGHIVNNHSLVCDSNLYNTQEVETNYFTAQLLMPEQVINEFIRRGKTITIGFLVNTFGVSSVAAKKRIETLKKLSGYNRGETERIYDDIILWKFDDFINTIAPLGKELDWFEKDLSDEKERESWT